jgi:acyl-CoA dehydrogenase
MQRLWATDALDFEAAVGDAMARLGGVDLARACEADDGVRAARLGPMLSDLGFDDLNPADGEVEACAAALGARALGAAVAPWPIVQRLTGNAAGARVGAVYLVGGPFRRAEHLDLAGDAAAIDVVARNAQRLVATGPLRRFPLDPFGVPCAVEEPVDAAVDELVGLHVVLTGFWVLGALETAMELTRRYATERHQFGKPIGAFGAIQWRLSDIAVAYGQLTEAAAYGLAAFIDGRLGLVDAFALRMQTIESAQAVLANAHQVLGAIGLCEEHDVTVIDRHLQSALRRPTGQAETTALLAQHVATDGFDGLYPVHPRVTDAPTA